MTKNFFRKKFFRRGVKSIGNDLICLDPESCSLAFLDGAAIVHMLKTGTATTFSEYSESVFIPYVKKCIQSVQRLDIAWDQYKQDSLKADTREKQGKLKGIRRKDAASTKLPGNWQDLLKDNANKEELFSFLTSAVCCQTFPEGKTVVATKGVATQSNKDFSMPDCFQEEADTRMLFHMKHMIESGLITVTVSVSLKTVESDVVVILVGLFYKIADQVDDIWVEYGVGKHLQYLSIRTMYIQLGE